jgi:hypothetical protein
MDITCWYFGYRCTVTNSDSGSGWFGDVVAPYWHPVRSAGVPSHETILFNHEWCVFTDGGKTRTQAMLAARCLALRLSVMQSKWDSLSPYEREYLVR